MKKYFILSILLIDFFPHCIPAQGVWTKKADFAGISRYAATSFSIGSKGYIGCGSYNTPPWTYPNDFWEYDPSSDIWTQKANFAGAGRRWGVGFAIGSKGYIGTGWCDSTAYSNDFWEYDPGTNNWAKKADVGGPLRHAAAGFSIESKGYIMSGYGGGSAGFLKDVWEYDPANNSWIQKASLPCPGKYYATGFSIGNKGYFGMGADSTNTSTTDFWEFDPVANTWSQKANYGGVPTQGAVGFTVGTKGFVIDGSSTWEYDPFADQWIQKTNYTGVPGSFKTGFSIGTKGYVCDESVYQGQTLHFYEFDPQIISNLLSGSVFSDTNFNCLKNAGDAPLANWFIEAKSAAHVLYGSTDNSGNYNIWVTSGSYTVNLLPKPYWNQVCPVSPSSYSVTVTGLDTINNLNFGAKPFKYCPDLALSIGTPFLRRCMKNSYSIQYWNAGTTTAFNVLLQIDFDDPAGRIIPLSCTLPWDSISGKSYFWHIDSIRPEQYVSFQLLDSVSCNTTLGDSLLVSAAILPLAGDCNGENNFDDDFRRVIGAYDPNEKLAYTSSNKMYRKQGYVLPADTISYTIHFQNTGTDTAFKVVVYDTLDIALDPRSVISGASSHPYRFELLGKGIIKWTFENILLPDSNINEAASHGFVKFRILQKPGNTNGILIKNNAAIVFDFNDPVITDDAVLTVNTPSGIQNKDRAEIYDIRIYPNPSNGKFKIRSPGGTIKNIDIYNILGEQIYSLNIFTSGSEHELNLSHQDQGVYFLKLNTSEGLFTRKIWLMKQ